MEEDEEMSLSDQLKSAMHAGLQPLECPYGRVKVKENFFDNIEIGMEGNLTAYLPEQSVFSVWFDHPYKDSLCWATFNIPEEAFCKVFDVVLKGKGPAIYPSR